LLSCCARRARHTAPQLHRHHESAAAAAAAAAANTQVIKETSALTFMIAGTVKEVVTVITAVIVFGDKFGLVNGIGLIIVIG
jgi:solute carrier family 35 protein C2